MHARVTTIQVQPDQMNELVAITKPFLPRARQAPGLKSFLMLGDRHTGKIVVVSRWDSEAAAEAAEPLFQEAMRELGRFMAGPPIREPYEVLLQE